MRSKRLPSPMPWGRLLMLGLLLPLALAGVVLNVLPYVALMLAIRYRSDAMTPSTIRMVAAVLTFLVMWIVWAAIAWSMWSWRMGVVALVASPLYGAIALYVLDQLTEWGRAWRGRRRVASLDRPTAATLDAERAALAHLTRRVAAR